MNISEFTGSCAKGLLIVLNFMCILVALITFGFAVVDLKILKQYGVEEAVGTYVGDIVIMVASLFLVGVATLGCVGTAWGKVKLLYLYMGFVMIMVILELLITIYVSLKRYGLQFKVAEWIREDFYKNLTAEETVHHQRQWDDMQLAYECCGLNGPEDYTALGQRVSLSCCPRAYRARTDYAKNLLYKSCIETMSFYKIGCEDEILGLLKSDADYLVGVVIITFWFEAASILLAMWVANHLRNRVQVYKNTVKY